MRAASIVRRLTVGHVTMALAICLTVGVAWALVSPLFDHTDPEVSAIQSLPGYDLRYPGTTLLRTVTRSSTLPRGGTTGAEVIEMFGMRATGQMPDIVFWYGEKLGVRGWRLTDTAEAGPLLPQLVWNRQCYDLRIATADLPLLPAGEPTPATSGYDTVYSVTIENICATPGTTG
jgi:hypothetical protein